MAEREPPYIVTEPTEAFWRFVDKSGECWPWAGALNGDGYGIFWDGERSLRAHRVAYEALNGIIPKGMVIDHLCRVRHCVNPDHMEPVTVRVNTLRGEGPTAANAQKTHCPSGHKFTPENTGTSRGRRACLTCKRLKMRAYRAARVAVV